jgi:hypothetical protein
MKCAAARVHVPVALLFAGAFMAHAHAQSAAQPQPDMLQPPEQGTQTQPMTVTSDSQAFCTVLLRAIDSASMPLPRDIRALREEGISLCDQGQVRLGVARLRRALVALKDEENTP